MLFLMVETFSNGGGQFRKKNENLFLFEKMCYKTSILRSLGPRPLENVIFDGFFNFQWKGAISEIFILLHLFVNNSLQNPHLEVLGPFRYQNQRIVVPL